MISLLLALSAPALSQPVIHVGGGAGFFSPLRRPLQLSPTLDGQADVTNLIDTVPGLGASAGVQLGAWLPRQCPGCGVQGVWRLGVGPTYSTEYVDVSLFARLVGFGSAVDVRPALQATGRIDVAEGVEVRPYLGLEGVRFVDLHVGTRVAFEVGDGPSTQARQCRDGDVRTLDAPTQDVQLHWIGPLDGANITFDYGGAYSGELANPMGQMKTLLSDTLAITGAAQSSMALKRGEAGVVDYASRMQDLGGKYGLDWTVPLTPADVPGALATNYLEIGRRAIDALLPKLAEHRSRLLLAADIEYSMFRADVRCVPTEVCTDGWWQRGRWTVQGTPAVTERRHEVRLLAPDSRTAHGNVRAMWFKIGNWYRQRRPQNGALFEDTDNLCTRGNGVDEELAVADSPSRSDCERWLSERAMLDRERRALVGSSMDLHAEQLDFAEEQTSQDCEEAEQTVRFEQSSLERWKEIASIAGDAQTQQVAADAEERVHEAQQRARAACAWSDRVASAGTRLDTALADRPARLAEIETERAALDAKIAECELLSTSD
ncbi:MAG: hypothetical protein KTR31_11715 [Myxococcales bacterium]|nr:hypothetical protein [Myxococcales bacterium]